MARHFALQLGALAPVLGQLSRAKTVGEAGEGAARIDGGELVTIADKNQTAPALAYLLDKGEQRPGRHHPCLVDDDDSASRDRAALLAELFGRRSRGDCSGSSRVGHDTRGDGKVLALQARQDPGGRLRADASLHFEDLSRLALP